mmetsp:Transcript_13205/g.36006  ORF Transcript_13205/g.36006 Transcript_13205/m.36006 type:complete len:226 (-) Transcript_13205:1232-1909(-)
MPMLRWRRTLLWWRREHRCRCGRHRCRRWGSERGGDGRGVLVLWAVGKRHRAQAILLLPAKVRGWGTRGWEEVPLRVGGIPQCCGRPPREAARRQFQVMASHATTAGSCGLLAHGGEVRNCSGSAVAPSLLGGEHGLLSLLLLGRRLRPRGRFRTPLGAPTLAAGARGSKAALQHAGCEAAEVCQTGHLGFQLLGVVISRAGFRRRGGRGHPLFGVCLAHRWGGR